MKLTREQKKKLLKMRKVMKKKYQENLHEITFGKNQAEKITGLSAFIEENK